MNNSYLKLFLRAERPLLVKIRWGFVFLKKLSEVRSSAYPNDCLKRDSPISLEEYEVGKEQQIQGALGWEGRNIVSGHLQKDQIEDASNDHFCESFGRSFKETLLPTLCDCYSTDSE